MILEFNRALNYMFYGMTKCHVQDYNANMFVGDINDYRYFFNGAYNKDIKKEDIKKLYFTANSRYPRVKVSELTDIKRTTKPANADAIVVTGCTDNRRPEVIHIFKVDYQDLSIGYVISDWKFKRLLEAHNYVESFAIEYISNDIVSDFQEQWRHLKPKTKDIKIEYLGFKPHMYLTMNEVKEMKLIDENRGKCITEAQLDKIIQTELEEFNDEGLKSFIDLINSKDPGVVKLGVEMLNNFNFSKYKCRVFVALCEARGGDTSYNFVAFDNVLTTLGVSKNDFRRFQGNKLGAIHRIYKNIIDSEDKLYARQIMLDYIKFEVQKQLKNFENFLTTYEIGLKYSIDLLED
jgi:hypothetical protein